MAHRQGLFVPLRLSLADHDLVPLRRRYLEFLDGGLDRIVVVFSLNDTEVLVLCAKLHAPTIHLTPRSSASGTDDGSPLIYRRPPPADRGDCEPSTCRINKREGCQRFNGKRTGGGNDLTDHPRRPGSECRSTRLGCSAEGAPPLVKRLRPRYKANDGKTLVTVPYRAQGSARPVTVRSPLGREDIARHCKPSWPRWKPPPLVTGQTLNASAIGQISS
jgi:hypothetical protein